MGSGFSKKKKPDEPAALPSADTPAPTSPAPQKSLEVAEPKSNPTRGAGVKNEKASAAKLAKAEQLESSSDELLKNKRVDKALSTLLECLSLRQELHGAHHSHVGDIYLKLGVVYSELGRFSDARQKFTQCLAIKEDTHGSSSAEVVPPLRKLAQVLLQVQKPQDALEHLERILAIDETRLGPYDLELLPTLVSIATCHNTLKRTEETICSYQLATKVADGRDGLPDGDPRWIPILAGHAQVLSTIGNHDEAVPLLERGLKMTQKAHGKISPQTVTWLMQLTRAHAQMEVCKIEGANYTKAVQYARRAVDICEGGSSKGARLRLAATLNNLGGLHELMANYVQAAEPRLRCIKVLEVLFPQGHPSREAALLNLVHLLDLSGVHLPQMIPPQEALKFQKEALSLTEQRHSHQKTRADREALSAAMQRVACTTCELRQFQPAIYMMRRAVQFVWEEDAAIRIQASLKGHMTRIKLERSKPKKPKEKKQQPTTVHGLSYAERMQLPWAMSREYACTLIQACTRGWISRRRVAKLRQRAERRKQFAQQKDELVYELRDERPPLPQIEDPRETELEAMARQMEEEERKLAEAEAAEAARLEKKDAQRRLRHRPSARAQQARGVALALCRLAATHYCAEEFEQALKIYDRMSMYQTHWLGHGDPEISQTISNIQLMFDEDYMRGSFSFSTILQHVQQGEHDWFPPKRSMVMFWSISGPMASPSIEMETLTLPYYARPKGKPGEGEPEARRIWTVDGVPVMTREDGGEESGLLDNKRLHVEQHVSMVRYQAQVLEALLLEVVSDECGEVIEEVMGPLREEHAAELRRAEEEAEAEAQRERERQEELDRREYKKGLVDYQRTKLRLLRMYGTTSSVGPPSPQK